MARPLLRTKEDLVMAQPQRIGANRHTYDVLVSIPLALMLLAPVFDRVWVILLAGAASLVILLFATILGVRARRAGRWEIPFSQRLRVVTFQQVGLGFVCLLAAYLRGALEGRELGVFYGILAVILFFLALASYLWSTRATRARAVGTNQDAG